MAFFFDGTSSYLSLSLSPAGDKKVYVFKMTERQVLVASRMLPSCLAASLIAFFSIAAIGTLGKLVIGGWLNESLQTDIELSLASLGAVVAFTECGLFMWVRFSPSSLLSEGQRKRLCHMALYRRLSWMAYAAFFFSALSPCLGLLVLPDSRAGLGWDAGFLTYFYVVQVGFIGSLLIVFLVRRLLIISSWKGLTKAGDHGVAQ